MLRALAGLLFGLLVSTSALAGGVSPPGANGTANITGGTISGADVSGANVTATGGGTPQSIAKFMTNVIWAPNYGTCTWDATHDVGSCINAAIAQANALGGRTVLVPAGTYGVSTLISQPYSGVHLAGAGLGIPRDKLVAIRYLAVTRLVWIGAAGGQMFDEYAGNNATIYSGDTTGIVFDCANLADVCAKFTNVSYSTLAVGSAEPRKTGIWLATAGDVSSDGPGNQKNDIWFYSRSTSPGNTYSPTGILLDQGSGSNWNTSLNHIHHLEAWYAQGDGIVFGSTDNNLIDTIVTFKNPTNGTARPVVFANAAYTMPNGDAVNGNSYANIVLKMGAAADVLGYQSGSTIAAGGGNTGTGAVSTTTLTTSAVTAGLTSTLNFASVSGVSVGMSVNCGAGANSGVMPNSTVASVTATTVVLAQTAITTVSSGTACTFGYGVTNNAVAGAYTISATDATHFSIAAPTGGHNQSGIAISGGVITFTDLVLPMTGTPAAGDTWALTVPTPSNSITIAGVDKANVISNPVAEPGATSWYSTTKLPQLLSSAGGVSGHPMFGGSALTLDSGASDCGTSPSAVGNDSVGRVTVGSSTNGGKCTLTFVSPWTHPPVCWVTDETSAVSVRPVPSTTALQITGSIVAGDKLGYGCSDWQQ